MRYVGEVLSRWAARRKAASLKHNFIKKRDACSLQACLIHLINHDLPFPLQDEALRDALFSMADWPLQGVCSDYLFALAESYLVANCHPDHKLYWQSWIRLCRQAGRKLDVTGPHVSLALRECKIQVC